MIKKCLKIFIVSLFLFNFSISLVAAGDETRDYDDPIIFEPQVTIPGSNFIKGEPYEMGSNTTTLAKYVKAIYDYLLSIVGIAAAIVLMVGGVMWLTAGGSSERVGQAKSWISGSITGLVLALSSYLIMQTINPQLVSFTPTKVPKIRPIETGCCQYRPKGMPSNVSVAEMITDTECYLINTTKTDPLVPPVSDEYLEENKLSKYLENQGVFFQDKRPTYETGICEEFGYCEIVDTGQFLDNPSIQNRQDRTVITTMTENQCLRLNGQSNESFWGVGTLSTSFYKKEKFEEEEQFAFHRSVYNKVCEGREGSSCNNSKYIYCYCYAGIAYINEGTQNEPCGNDGGKCIPNLDVEDFTGQQNLPSDEDEFCEIRDAGSRSCIDDFICCKPSGIWGGYNPGQKY